MTPDEAHELLANARLLRESSYALLSAATKILKEAQNAEREALAVLHPMHIRDAVVLPFRPEAVDA